MYVKTRFDLDPETKIIIDGMQPEFGYSGFGEFIFYRTYSRTKPNGYKETWNDVVIRVTEGIFSIRKDWYLKNNIHWDESFWQHYAQHFAISLFRMEWMPPGRGLWAMGTDYIYERGSMALQNCGFTRLGKYLGDDCAWLMDALMCGVGVGFMPERDDDLVVFMPKDVYSFNIPDTREGWVESVKLLIDCYTNPGLAKPIFDYTSIRGPGLPIRGFGGISSGPAPLSILHCQIEDFFKKYLEEGWYDSVLLKTDLANAIGCAVVSGNVRRSAQLSCLSINDPIFLDLKDYTIFPYRANIGWMSNNSVILEEPEDFEALGLIAERVITNGEPGYINKRNMRYGRIGKNDNVREDHAIGFNPCGEQPLEDKELCTLAETCPTRCDTMDQWLRACEYATVYASTVTLLPTHQAETNRVMCRNRRIGVGIIDVSGLKHALGTSLVIKWLRKGYEKIRKTNQWINSEAGVPEAIRVTTIKPGGTVPKVVGRTSGAGNPTFDYTLRRVRVARNSQLCKLLDKAKVPCEPDVNQPDTTLVYSFPILQGPAKPADRVSLWEQAMNLVMLQREWSDNAVSNTLYFKPKWILHRDLTKYTNKESFGYKTMHRGDNYVHLNLGTDCFETYLTNDPCVKITENAIYLYNKDHELDDIEPVLSAIAPLTKSVSLLPHTAKGVYPQMPEEGITQKEYVNLLKNIDKIDWSQYREDFDTETDKYCEGDKCQIT